MTSAARPLLVNEGEFRTDAALREAAADLGFGVHTKVRVADALTIDHSGLSAQAYSYALRAHFDWVVTDLATTTPEFAVEFDGASHAADDARRRDALKDRICRHLDFPLLRIDRSGFRPSIRRTVIWYLVESWALMQAFNEAQESGAMPLDEVFDPAGFLDGIDEDGYIRWRDLAGPARLLVHRLHNAGLLTVPVPWHASRTRRPADPCHAEAFAWVETSDGRLVVGHTRLRAYSFPAVIDFELAESLAHMDLADRLARWREGDRSVLVDPDKAGLPNLEGRPDWSFGGMLRGPGHSLG